MVPQETVLAVGGEVIDVVAPLLEQSPYRVQRAPDGRTAVLLACKMRFHNLVVAFPLPDLALGDLAESLRQPDSASPTVRILLLTTDEHLAEASSFRDEGLITGALSVDLEPERLVEALTGFMKSAPRVSAALPIRLLPSEGEAEPIDGETVNVSETGLMMRCETSLPRGTKVRVELTPPSHRESISATAIVVREVRPAIERHSGLGLRFVGFEGDGQARLAVQIRRILAELVG